MASENAHGKASSLKNAPQPDKMTTSLGGIAQLVERLVRNEKARGSNPLTSSLRSSLIALPKIMFPSSLPIFGWARWRDPKRWRGFTLLRHTTKLLQSSCGRIWPRHFTGDRPGRLFLRKPSNDERFFAAIRDASVDKSTKKRRYCKRNPGNDSNSHVK